MRSILLAFALVPGVATAAVTLPEGPNVRDIRVSPDGAACVYREGAPGRGALVIRSPRGDRRLPDTPERFAGEAEWSPDGIHLLLRVREPGPLATPLLRLVLLDARTAKPALVLPPGEASFAPDGTRLAHVDETGRLTLRGADGSSKLLGRVPLEPPAAIPRPAFAPDGSRIAVGGVRDRQGVVGVWPVAGWTDEADAELPVHGALGVEPFWAPGSDAIGVLAVREGATRLLLWDPKTSGAVEVYRNDRRDPKQRPLFSPDGRRIFLLRRTSSANELCAVPVVGSGLIALAPIGDRRGALVLRRDGRVAVEGDSVFEVDPRR